MWPNQVRLWSSITAYLHTAMNWFDVHAEQHAAITNADGTSYHALSYVNVMDTVLARHLGLVTPMNIRTLWRILQVFDIR